MSVKFRDFEAIFKDIDKFQDLIDRLLDRVEFEERAGNDRGCEYTKLFMDMFASLEQIAMLVDTSPDMEREQTNKNDDD